MWVTWQETHLVTSFPLHWGKLFASRSWRTDRTRDPWRRAILCLVKGVGPNVTVGTLRTSVSMTWAGWLEPWASGSKGACLYLCTYKYTHPVVSNLLPH